MLTGEKMVLKRRLYSWKPRLIVLLWQPQTMFFFRYTARFNASRPIAFHLGSEARDVIISWTYSKRSAKNTQQQKTRLSLHANLGQCSSYGILITIVTAIAFHHGYLIHREDGYTHSKETRLISTGAHAIAALSNVLPLVHCRCQRSRISSQAVY